MSSSEELRASLHCCSGLLVLIFLLHLLVLQIPSVRSHLSRQSLSQTKTVALTQHSIFDVPPTQGLDALLAVIEIRNKALRQQAGSQHVERLRRFAVECFHQPLPPAPSVKNTSGNGNNWFIMLDNPFPPCVRSIDELEPVSLSDLVMDQHHRGKFLLVRLAKDMISGRTTAFACVCDQKLEFELLKLSFVCLNLDVGHRWPEQGHPFAIKEPYLTTDERNMEACLRVDHPSDLVDMACLPKSQLTRPVFSDFQAKADQRDMSPLQYKESANSALKAGDLDKSLSCYNQGRQYFTASNTLELTASVDVRCDLFQNRSYVRLKLGQYEGAVTDAIASLSGQTTDHNKGFDAKAYSRASQASYALKNYDAAAMYCRKLLDLNNSRADGLHLLSKIELRLSEQTSGVYDIATIQDNVARQNPRVDAAAYLDNTMVKASGPNRGRGLFATKDSKAGDLILAETAFASVWDDERTHVVAAKWNARFPKDIDMGLIGLWKVALQRVTDNPILGARVLDLHGDHNGIGKDVVKVDGVQVVDTYQVHGIVARNAFQLEGSRGRKSHCSGVYIRSSYINHSCVPNSHRTTVGDLLLLSATKDIKKGEELSISYGPDLQAFSSRREAIMSMWNFQCNCPLCVADAQVPVGVVEKRGGLAKAADSFMKRSSSRDGMTNSMILRAEQLARDIAATYDNTLYSGLPRTALTDIQSWLVDATLTCGQVEKSMRSMANLLRSLGYHVDVRNIFIDCIQPTTHSILTDSACAALWEPLVGTAVRRQLIGDVHIAAHLIEFVKAWDRIVHGSDAYSVEVFDEHVNANS
jgi:tetratricopeptide (TPR) repeat protein